MGAYLLEAQRRGPLPPLLRDMTTPAQWEVDRKKMNEIVDKGDYIRPSIGRKHLT